MSDLPTVNLEGVEILAANVEIHGVGSPPEGDVYTPDDLRAMAAAAQELEAGGEWRVPMKIGQEPLGRSKLGHGKQQTLLSSIDPGEFPAAGWLSNQRVSDDGTKLLADIHDVPAKVASLIKARAYRTRSAELARVKSQKTGKTYDWVVSGLAWLGGKMPAVRTLDEVAAWYEGDDSERRFLAVTDVDDAELDELRDAVAAVGIDIAKSYVTVGRGRADIRASVAEKTYTDEQRRTFAEATGLEPDKVTDEMLAAAGVPSEEEKPKADPAVQLEADERLRSLEQRATAADERSRKLEEELRVERRDAFVDQLVSDGKVEPGQRAEIVAMYDEAPTSTRKFFESAKPREDLLRELGADEGDVTEEEREAAQKSYEADATSRLGIPEGAVL